MLQTRRLSIFAIILAAFSFLFVYHYNKVWRTAILTGGDHWGYYIYLPATFIHHDLSTLDKTLQARLNNFPSQLVYDHNPLGIEEAHQTPEGKQVIKYTVGVAILNAPFFFLAHFLTKLSGAVPDGFSFPYMYLVNMAGILYGLLGFYFLRKFLLQYFSDAITALTILIIAFGTNLFYFATFSAAMSHIYLFALYSLLLYCTSRFYLRPSVIKAVLVGLFAGFIVLIRPTEIICLAIPFLWGITSLKAISERLKFWKMHFGKLVAAAITFILAGVPQLLYWKKVSGNFLHYSYKNETFDFAHPKIADGLFSYMNGWLAYTPIMYFAVFGLIFLFRRREFLLPVTVFLLLHIYIIYSWWCWNYINGFGSRPMVEAYALLSIPLACCIGYIFRRKLLAIPATLLLLFFTWLNLFNIYQLQAGVLISEENNWQFYKNAFYKTKLDYADLVRYDTNLPFPDERELKFEKLVAENKFNDSLDANFMRDKAQCKYIFKVDNQRQYSPTVEASAGLINANPGDWLKISVDCKLEHLTYNLYAMNKMVVEVKDGENTLHWQGLRLDNKVGNPEFLIRGDTSQVWGTAYFWLQIPENFSQNGVVKSYIWNPAQPPVYIDNHKIELWRKK